MAHQAVARDTAAKGRGVLAVLNDDVHFTRETTKTSTTFLQTFHSPNRGLAGIVLAGVGDGNATASLRRAGTVE